MFKQFIKKSIHKSQHCNRNWDLSKSIPDEDIDLIIESATQCPVKQNLDLYKTHVITDRNLIEKIHSHTEGIIADGGTHKKGDPEVDVMTTNTQTLANLLLVFTKDYPRTKKTDRSGGYVGPRDDSEIDNPDAPTYIEDRIQSVGIASAYVNFTASMLGYETGCCKCFDVEAVRKVLGTDDREEPLLLMGVGYPDKKRSRLEHHNDSSLRFPTRKNRRTYEVHA